VGFGEDVRLRAHGQQSSIGGAIPGVRQEGTAVCGPIGVMARSDSRPPPNGGKLT